VQQSLRLTKLNSNLVPWSCQNAILATLFSKSSPVNWAEEAARERWKACDDETYSPGVAVDSPAIAKTKHYKKIKSKAESKPQGYKDLIYISTINLHRHASMHTCGKQLDRVLITLYRKV